MESLELEMEELDGLVSHKNSFEKESLCSFRNRKRVVSLSVIVALLIFILYTKKASFPEKRVIGIEDGNLTSIDDTPKEPKETPQAEEPNDETKPEETVEEKPKPKRTSKIPELPLDRDQLELSDEKRDELVEKWGQWHFWDGDENRRPKEDYCAKYPNRDIPGDDFPDNSWQVDAVFVNHYLNDADKLIGRAMEAIFTEYGKGKPMAPEKLAERLKMFHWEKLDLKEQTSPPPDFARRGQRTTGGWTTSRSFQGLVRRLLHAMITQDTFTVVQAGHSASAGEGNHFRQSYMMQFYKIMRPIFARLGVKLVTRNISQGGLGTVQGAMGSAGIYGDEIDLMIWDSGMTENSAPQHIDLFLRQALIGGNRVPVVWGGNFQLLRMLHEEADADVGEFGWATADMPVTENEEQMKTLPYAYQSMKCTDEHQDLCNDRDVKYSVTCWIDRPDGIKPDVQQLDRPRGQVKWHPGWRSHQLIGRNLAFAVLEGLQVAINTWSEATMTGQPLDESYWHVTKLYENTRDKVRALDPKLGDCYKIEGMLPTRMCNTPMQGRTQYTPRAYPDERSIAALVQPTSDGYVPRNEKVALYEGPDVHIPDFDLPEGAIDVLAIVENRRRRLANRTLENGFKVQSAYASQSHVPSSIQTERRLGDNDIVPGKGWEVYGEPQGHCDGSYEAVCGRSTDNDCILPGYHDGRGAVIGNEYAGWLVMKLKDVKEGIIVVKLHTWHNENENTRTEGWTTVNQERQLLRAGESDQDFPSDLIADVDDSDERRLKWRNIDMPDFPDSFMFEYAINGKINTLSKDKFLERRKPIQRVVETVTLLDDKDFSNEKPQDVEVAIRLRGSGKSIVFGVSHIYWA